MNNRVFELEPKARSLFDFTDDEEIRSNPKFSFHARNMLDMLDMAVGFLGPDLDYLRDDLHDLGRRHVSYGVDPSFLPVMERAVMYALEEFLDGRFTREDRKSWQAIFHFMVSSMMQGMKGMQEI